MDAGGGGEAFSGIVGDGQEAVAAAATDRRDRGEASFFREESEVDARTRSGVEGVGGKAAGHNLGGDQREPEPEVHDPGDPSGARKAWADI